MTAGLITKTIKIRKCSHNKRTKTQRNAMKNHNFIVFERSFEECMKRLVIMRAYVRSNEELFKESKKRVYRLQDYIRNQYPKELHEYGYLDNYNEECSYIFNIKQRRVKISIEK